MKQDKPGVKRWTGRLLPLMLALGLVLGGMPQPAFALEFEPPKPPLPVIKFDITAKFTDANFLAVVRTALGKGASDPIYSSDVAEITTLDVTQLDIASLAGIEYFTGLEKLCCYNNKLTALDLSKNTALKELFCYYNELTALDVSKNIALTILSCSSNPLKDLDVRNNTALESLYCTGAGLTSLDLSQNTALTVLFVSSNKLKSLDLSKNTALELFTCFYNQLISLDVRKNTALKELYCYGNRLGALDVSKNTALEILSCYGNELAALDVSKNAALRSLICNDTQLDALDVRKNTALEYLLCYNNELTGLDVSSNTVLQELYCAGNFMPSVSAVKGAGELQLTKFVFEPQKATPAAPQALAAAPGDRRVTLSWTMPAYGGATAITAYEVSSNGGAAWITVGTGSSYIFTGLTVGQSYDFRVRAVNSAGSGAQAAVTAAPEAAPAAQPFYSNASSWAVPELDKAAGFGLIPDILNGADMTKPITREEFAELSVLLYEKSTGVAAAAVSPNPFSDTANPQILKAYKIGITTGTSDTTFSPEVLISREQCATMLYRAIKAIAPAADYSLAGVPDFPDQKDIASWAVEGTKYMSKLGIIKGGDNGNFMPKPLTPEQEATRYGMASKEAAVLMSVRTFEKVN